jgi:hypothetical protein
MLKLVQNLSSQLLVLIFLLPLFKNSCSALLKSESVTVFMISFYDLKWKDRLHVVLIFAFLNFQNR